MVGQAGQFQRVGEPAGLAHAGFFFQQQVEEVQVAHLGGLGPLDQFGDRVGGMGQAQPGGVGADPVDGQAAHARPVPAIPW